MIIKFSPQMKNLIRAQGQRDTLLIAETTSFVLLLWGDHPTKVVSEYPLILFNFDFDFTGFIITCQKKMFHIFPFDILSLALPF
jgi:hypothetical protein